MKLAFLALALLACGDGDEGAAEVAPEVEAEVAIEAEATPEVEPETQAEVEVVPEVVALPALAINEFDCAADWVELVATGDATVALDGLELSDGDNRLALSGAVAPGAHVVVTLSDFGLSCGNEGPLLYRDDALVDAAPPGNAPAGYSFGRFPDVTGEFVVTALTQGEANALPEGDPFDPAAALFGYLRPIATIDLALPTTSLDALWGDPYAWVPATFTWTDADRETLTKDQPVAVRVKGRVGSYRDLNGKSAFKLDVARFWPDATFVGVDELTLNNMVQDYNRINEVLAYDLFARMGVAVPRVSYVWLTFDGQEMGLYLNLEALDGRWRERHFASTLGMFEGEYGDDLFVGMAFQLDLDGGEEAARLALHALTEAIASAPRVGFMEALAPYLDWDEVLAMMATEVFIGHWDGYASTRNNYFVHFDRDGVARLVPWGVDQVFAYDLGFYEGDGLLLRGCVDDPVCRLRWEDKLSEVAAIVTSEGYLHWADALADHIQPAMDDEPREDAGSARDGIQGAWDFLERRVEQLEDLLACTRDPDADIDGDGHTCDDDCEEGDPDRYYGAIDVCGDGIDQDCSGRADDADDCPDCSDVVVDEVRYRLCWRDRTHDEATTLCAEDGGHLVVTNSPAEVLALNDLLNERGFPTAWIGLDDIEREGDFRWVTGGEGEGGWMDGQPDDYFEAEDCVQVLPWGGERPWNDLHCDSAISVVCEYSIARAAAARPSRN